jgi:hypothetical protein|tara:strand:+ start:122 stop:664 length:543 start_codon:yes stop_codon:yes gene_type:complete
MKTKYFLLIFSLISLLILSACKNPFRYTDAREIPVDGRERVKKNIEEGRGITIFSDKPKGGVFDFASSNELWRASIEVLDFVSFTNASYSGGILITDWFSGNTESNENNQREIKITVRFLSNEIRADGIQVVIHEKVCSDKTKLDCKINKIKSSIGNDVKLAILKKAALLKKESEKKTKK